MRPRFPPALAAAAAAALAAAAQAADSRPALRAFTSIDPQRYFVERIGGDRVRVEALVPPGQDYHTFEPRARQMARLSEAQVYFRLGLPFEEAVLPKIQAAVPALVVVDTRPTPPPPGTAEAHAGHDHAHAPGEPDLHTWLSPTQALAQSRAIAAALAVADPAGRPAYEAGFAALARDLEALHRRLTERFAARRGQHFLVFHPAWGCFAETYGLRQVAIEVEGKAPAARQLAQIIDRARQSGARVVFAQPHFDAKPAQAVADAIGARVVVLDPLSPDYVANLERSAAEIEKGLVP